MDYAFSLWIMINGGIYLDQETLKSILDLHLNPGEGIVYVQSAVKGLSLLCCCSQPNSKTKEIKKRELALNAMEQTHQFKDYIKYIKGTVARQLASSYWTSSRTLQPTWLSSGCYLETGVVTSSTSIKSMP